MAVTPAPKNWTCPKCRRKFARPQQRHICGSGTRTEVLKNRREEVVALFEALEAHLRTFGPVEFVPRERYIIVRGKHIFADVIMLADALKVVIHLPRMVRHPLFRKTIADRRWVSHLAKVRNLQELEQMKPFLQEAWAYSETY